MNNYRRNIKYALFIVLLLLGQLIFSCTPIETFKDESKVDFVDLRKSNNKVFRLNLRWDFYANQLVQLKPSQTNFTKKQHISNGNWAFLNKSEEEWHSGTYCLKVLAGKGSKIGLGVNLVHSSYRIWADDEMIEEVGFPSNEVSKRKHLIKTGVAFFQSKKDTTNIFIEVANYEDNMGGIIRPITIGEYGQIINLRERNLLIDSLVNVMVLSLALYNILLYFFENRSKAYLFFGIFCIFEVIRAFSIGIIAWSVFIPNLTLSWLNVLKIPTFFLGFSFATLYFHYSLNGLYKYNLEKIIFYTGLFSAFLFIVLPPLREVYVTLSFEFIAFIFAIYSLYLIFKKIQSGNPSAWIPFWGFLCFCLL